VKEPKGTTSKRPRKKKEEVVQAQQELTPAPEKPSSPFSWRGPERRDDTLYFAREDLLTICLTEAKGVNALQAVAIHRSFIRDQAARHEAERRAAEIEMARLTSEASALERLNKQMWEDVGRTYEIDFSRASYDDTTGRITLLEDDMSKKETQDG
jgi:hypothetical protein